MQRFTTKIGTAVITRRGGSRCVAGKSLARHWDNVESRLCESDTDIVIGVALASSSLPECAITRWRARGVMDKGVILYKSEYTIHVFESRSGL